MLNSRSILVVESDCDRALKLLHVFECEGATVQVVDTVADAMMIVKTDAPDAIVVDSEMPAAQCASLVMAVRCLFGPNTLPIVVLSALDQEPWHDGSSSSPDVRAIVAAVEHAIERLEHAMATAWLGLAARRPLTPHQRMFEYLAGGRAPAA